MKRYDNLFLEGPEKACQSKLHHLRPESRAIPRGGALQRKKDELKWQVPSRGGRRGWDQEGVCGRTEGQMVGHWAGERSGF